MPDQPLDAKFNTTVVPLAEPVPPVSEKKDTQGKKKFAFRDVRNAIELLASGRPPFSLKFIKNNPVSKKLSKFTNKGKSVIAKGLNSKFMKSKLVSVATKAAMGPIGAAVFATVAGKIKIPGAGKIAGGVGKITGSLSSIQKFAQLASVGVSIAEQLNPNKIRRPLKEGLSASASAAAKSLAETAAASTVQSLLTGAPLASALPTLPTPFKTAASLVKSPRFFNPTNTAYTVDVKQKQVADTAVKHVVISTPETRLYPQRGLLEDELMYRLTLLAENVYAPARDYAHIAGLGAIQILEGFRSENNAISQHEMGEAIDITLGNGSLSVAQQCFQLAQWMRDNVLYDQLILCFDQSGGGQVWIHTSFKIDGRRRQVFTKTYNDTHISGLHIYAPSTGTDIETIANVKTGEKLLDMLAERQQRLQPIGLDTELPQQKPLSPASIIASGATSDDGGGVSDGECGNPDMSIPRVDLEAVFRAGRPDGKPYDFGHSEDGGSTMGGIFVEQVVAKYGGPWGLFKKTTGKQYHNHSTELIVYKSPTPLNNGKYYQLVDVIGSLGGDGARLQWSPTCAPFDDTDNRWYQ
jgi:hypothetical protein